MTEEGKVYLIPFDQATRIKDIPEGINGDAYSVVLGLGGDVEGAPAWATSETLEGLRALGLKPDILAERPQLPVFHGFSRYIETVHYEPVLSAIGYAKFDEEVRGICYIGFGCEREVWQMHSPELEDFFFYYSENECRQYIWIAVTTSETAKFLYNVMYHQDEILLAWLQGLGLNPLADDDEEVV